MDRGAIAIVGISAAAAEAAGAGWETVEAAGAPNDDALLALAERLCNKRRDMNGTRTRMSWSARLLIGLVLILAGAAAAIWGLAHYQPAARFLGIVPAAPASADAQACVRWRPCPQRNHRLLNRRCRRKRRIAELQERLARVENATQRAEGFAGRADALVVAFAARRAIDRGVALGYLENLLVDRFGAQHQQAVGTIIAASHQPVRLNDLIAAI